MATTSTTPRDEFLRLRKTGVDAVTARKQAYGDIIPPVGTSTPPVQNPPTVPPQQTTPPQTVTGVNGEQFQVAPVNPQTGLSQPVQTHTPPQSVPPVQQTAPEPVKTETTPPQSTKTEAPIDYTQAKGREQDIIKNLDTFKAQGMTPEQIIKASDYANASPEKKALIEPYLKQSPVTASSLYNLIASKQEVPLEQKSSGAYRVANNRYQRVNQYVNMTPTEVNQAFTSGKLVEGSQTFEDLKLLNPKLVQDAVNLRKVNGNKTNIFTYTNNPDGTPVKTNNLEKQFTEQYSEDHPDIIELLKSVYNTPTYAQMQAQINTPEVKAAQDKASEIETEMNSLQTAMDSVDKDVDAELKGSGATSSRIALEKSARKAELQKQYDAKLRDYTTQYNKATNLINQNTEMFKYTQEQNKAMQTALAGVYTKQYENQLALQQNQAEYDQKIKQQAQAMNDPTTAIKSVMDEYKKLGIPFTSTVQSRLAEFKASGKPLEQFLTEMSQNIQQSPAYKAYAAKKAGEGISYQTIGNKVYKIGADGSITETNISTGADESKWGVIGKNADGSDKYGFINTATSTVTPYIAPTGEATGDLRYLANQYPGQAWAKNNNPAGITWNSNFDKGTGTAKLFADAGIKFEKGTARPANEGGNYVTFATIEDGLKAQQILMTQTYGNSTVGQMLSSWVGTSEGPNYAKQVAGMAGITDLNQKVSALSPEQVSKLQMAKIQKESPGLAKLLTQPITTPTNANQYTDQNVNDLAYLTELQEKNPTQAAKDMKELGYTARDLANYKAGNVPLTEKQKTTSTDIISSITDLVTNYDWNDAVGKFDYTRLIGTQDAEDTNVAINNLVAKLTLPNLGVLKGPMSDKDIQFIKEASSKLSTTQSNSSFERNLIDAYNLAARRAGKPEIKKLSDISAGTQSSTVGGELDYSKYE